MLAEGVGSQQAKILDAANERIHLGPVPDWVVPCPYRMDFKSKPSGQVTHLLLNQQIHAERHETFVQKAIRLETTQAVHDAPVRIAFEPRTQHFTLHWLRIHRAGAVLDRTALEHLHPVPLETDGFISPNHLNLMLLLDDVRPGDVLDICHTIQDQPLLTRDYCASLCSMPGGVALGKCCFSVRFHEGRSMRWKSSSPELKPVETREGGEIHWLWNRENVSGGRVEENTPTWHIIYPWIQVSDFPDWESVADVFADAWKVEQADADLAVITPELATGEGTIMQQTEKAIQLVQDQYRYVAVAGELDEEPPANPAEVARRRYGDSKDLSVLLMVLLKRLGLEARLVLVNTNFRKSLAGLLPMPSLFNHIVVEYKTRGRIRWADATAKGQGGGSLNRIMLDFGVGLPLVRSGAGLIEAPAQTLESNVYQIKESMLLDTSGAPSMFAIVVTARGRPAEEMRRELETHGIEAFDRRRLQMCVDRFIDVKRASPMEYRDNRTENEFFLAEVFEVKDFLKEDVLTSWFKLEISAEVVANLLPLPIPAARHAPYSLPHPCHVAHILEVYCLALPPAIVQQRTIENPWLRFTRMRKTLAGFWTVTTTLSTLADAVPPEGVDEYREAVRDIRAQCNWAVLVPAGQDRPFQRSDFGRLPASWEASAGSFPAWARTTPTLKPVTLAPAPIPAASMPRSESTPPSEAPAIAAPSGQEGETQRRRRKRHRRRSRENDKAIVAQAVVAFFLVVVLLVLAYVLFGHAGSMFVSE